MRALSFRSLSIVKLSLWGLAAIPLVLSCIAWLTTIPPHPMQTPPRALALAFDQYVLDVRYVKIPPRDYHHWYFAFRNLGDRPLKITSMDPSCGCLKPTLCLENKNPNNIIHPGEAGEILLRIAAANQDPGEREYWVDVNYEDPEPHQRRIALKMNFPKEQVWVQPKGLVFYPGRSSLDIPPQDVTISDLRENKINILGLECDDPYVKCVLVKPDSNNSEESKSVVGKLQISLTGPLPSGNRQAVVKIFTDDPAQRYHELRVPIMVNMPKVLAERALSINAD